MRFARSFAFAATLPFAAIAYAQACGEGLGGGKRIVENGHYIVAYATTPAAIEINRHFVVDFVVCPRGGARSPQSVRIDASMPEHRHGMNYRPGVTVLRPGTYRAEGLLFHMPGRWDLTFDVVAGNATERLTSTMRVE